MKNLLIEFCSTLSLFSVTAVADIHCLVQTYWATRKDKSISMHQIPKIPSVRKLWTKFVLTHRKQWKGPTKYIVIFSRQVTSDLLEGDSVKAALSEFECH